MIDRKQFQKPKEKDFFFVWHFQRKISGIVALILNNTFITPNHVTLLSIIVGLYSFYYFFIGGAFNDLIGILLFQLSFLLDCIDGDLSRLRTHKGVRYSGAYFDYLRSILLEPLLPIFLTIGLVMHGYPTFIVVPIIVVSIWKWTPQFSREHIVIRQLEHDKELVYNSQLFVDMQKGYGNTSFLITKLISKVVIIFWGLPIGFMNTITVLAFLGIYFLSPTQYNEIKFIYLALLTIFYFLHFIKSAVNEYKLLNEIKKTGER